MLFTERFIWLPKDKYPNNQTTCFACGGNPKTHNYTVAEFAKKYTFKKKVSKAVLRFTADTQFHLFLNNNLISIGPDVVGGDFLQNHKHRDLWFASEIEIEPDSYELDFFARVKMMPIELCEFSKGRGGFMLTGHLTFDDGTKWVINTDTTWLCRKNGAYVSPKVYDGSIKPDEFVFAGEQDNIWFPKTSPLPRRTEEVFSPDGGLIKLSKGEKKKLTLTLPMIYGGFINAVCKSEGKVTLSVHCTELGEEGSRESITFDGNDSYRSFELHSAGQLEVEVENHSNSDAEVKVEFIAIYFPIEKEAKTVTSDVDLNKVLEVCAHTLKICRQTHHLDSTRHCEPLACTGDYYIETLMTAFSYGDMRLAELDLLRTAEIFMKNDGKLYHPTYTLIWIMMMYDVYMYTGNIKILEECEEALLILLQRFESYVTELGIIDNALNYMFVDWIFIDGISMHHPPKALGQSVLNMFYFGGLDYAEKIFNVLGDKAMANDCRVKRENLGKKIREFLFDSEKGIFFEGLNTKIPDEMVCEWEQPQNIDKRYYMVHSNILACAFGVVEGDEAKAILEKVMSGEFPTSYQPYFAHFMFMALYRCGLRDKYTLEVLERWKAPVKECGKGLVEGFIPPDKSYVFDHSHAWGGTPLYSLPKALTGFEIVEAGMKKINLNPSLLGLERASVEIPTPYGFIIVEQAEGSQTKISCPSEIEIIE